MLSERFGDKRKMVKLGNKRRTISARYQVSAYIYMCVRALWGKVCVICHKTSIYRRGWEKLVNERLW